MAVGCLRNAAVAVTALLAASLCLNANSVDALRIQMPPQIRAVEPIVVPESIVRAGLAADVELELHESLFQKITADLLPIIIAKVRAMTIPGIAEKHFKVWEIKIGEFNINSLEILFAAPDIIRVSLTGLSLEIPSTEFEVMDKILFIHLTCHGHFSASMSNTNVAIDVPLIRGPDGHFAIGPVTPSVDFGQLSINEKMDHLLCKIGQDIIQLFIGKVTNLIENLIKKDAPTLIAKEVQKVLQTALSKLNVNLVTQPVATSNSLSATIDLLPVSGSLSGKHQRIRRGAPGPQGAFTARDIEVFTKATALNNLLEYERQRGHLTFSKLLRHVNTSVFKQLLPAAYEACPDCPLGFDLFFPTQAPKTEVQAASIGMTVTDGVLGLTANRSDGSGVPLVELSLNATGALANVSTRGAAGNVIFFDLSLSGFTIGLWKSSIGPFDPSVIGGIIAFVLEDVVIPDFNKNFQGFPIPSFGSLTVTQVEIALNNSAVDLGLDVSL